MNLDEFIKLYQQETWIVSDDPCDPSFHIMQNDVPRWVIELAQALKTQDERMREFVLNQNHNLLLAMTCSCKINGNAFGEYLHKCERCKQLEKSPK